MDNVTLKKLKKTHGADAEKVFNEIAALGGWGDGREYHDSPGGLDIKGLPDGAAKTKILALLSVEKEPEAEGETVESLVKNHSREELEVMAKQVGLDGDTYTNKQELAKAFLDKKGE